MLESLRSHTQKELVDKVEPELNINIEKYNNKTSKELYWLNTLFAFLTIFMMLAIFSAGLFGDKTIQFLDYAFAFVAGVILIYLTATYTLLSKFGKLTGRELKKINFIVSCLASIALVLTTFASFPPIDEETSNVLVAISLISAVIALPLQFSKLTYEYFLPC